MTREQITETMAQGILRWLRPYCEEGSVPIMARQDADRALTALEMAGMIIMPKRDDAGPFEVEDTATELQDRILELLEQADFPTDISDRIMRLVAQGERAIEERPR